MTWLFHPKNSPGFIILPPWDFTWTMTNTQAQRHNTKRERRRIENFLILSIQFIGTHHTYMERHRWCTKLCWLYHVYFYFWTDTFVYIWTERCSWGGVYRSKTGDRRRDRVVYTHTHTQRRAVDCVMSPQQAFELHGLSTNSLSPFSPPSFPIFCLSLSIVGF